MADLTKFDPKAVTRNKCLAWGTPSGEKKPKALMTDFFLNDNGTVNTERCTVYSVAPGEVVYLTPEDLDGEYTKDAKSALQFHAHEEEMAPQDVIWKLVIADAMQNLANASVAKFRQVTDKAKERATSTLLKILKEQGKTDAEIAAVMSALA